MDDKIATSAEALEGAALHSFYEAHTDPDATAPDQTSLPNQNQAPKSPARWAYERLILYIQNFEKQLDAEQEVAMGFAGDSTGVIRIEGMGYFDPDLITFYGSDPSGARTQLVQHVSQLSVMLRSLPKPDATAQAKRIGFRLAEQLNRDTATS